MAKKMDLDGAGAAAKKTAAKKTTPKKAAKKTAPKKSKTDKPSRERAAPADAELQTFGGSLPEPKAIKEHVDNVRGLKMKAAAVSQQISNAVKNAEKDHNIDRWTGKLIVTLAGMDEETRNARLQQFRHACMSLGWGEQRDLFANDVGQGENEEALERT